MMAVPGRPSTATAFPPESFAIVRPPPSKGNHPLNVQVQLIAPVAAAFARPSGEMSRSDSSTSQPESFQAVAQASVGGGPGSGLQRSASVRSNRSGRSASSSTGSTLGGGSGRKVTPLYNLSFHAVMTTVVTDAGTDAKIAKFLKRGVEIMGLAIIDPVELSPSSSPSALVALAKSRSPERRTPPSQPTTPADPPTSFLNRFKRMSFKPPSLPAALALPKSDSAASLTTATGQAVVPLFRTPSTEPSPLTNHLAPSTATPAVKGYSWTVRKWLRRDLEGKAGALAAQSVRFEWRRGDRKPHISPSPAPSVAPTTDSGHLAATPTPASARPSLERRNSPIPDGETSTLDPNNLARKTRPESWAPGSAGDRARSPAFGGSDAGGGGSDDGYDSDPEDSERAWTCEVVYGPSGAQRRLLLGTLSPAPHHPKLVGLLAVPFALSPIALGKFEPGSGSGNEGLSVEEMKDFVCVTCLWLVVREGLGGLGRRRKGDGSWRFG